MLVKMTRDGSGENDKEREELPMRKGIIICITTCLAAVAVTLLVLVAGNRLAVKELEGLSKEEIKEVIVLANPPGTEASLSQEEIGELVEILNSVTVYRKDNSYNEYAGQWVEFTITKTDGTQLKVAAYSPFIIINGEGYQAKYEPCQALNGLANRVIEAAPVNLEQDEMEILVGDNRVLTSRAIAAKEKVLYALLPEEEDVVEALLKGGEWQEGAANCAKDCVILVNGDKIRYHSECGTFNDSKGKKHLELAESDKEALNAILGRYIKLEPELVVEEVTEKGESESSEMEKAPDAEGQGMAEGNAGGSVCQFVKMIKVKDQVYISTDVVVDILRCGVMDGKIESTVENGVLPEENNQSNFGIGFGYQFRSEDVVDVNIDGKWVMFVPADAEIFIHVEEEDDEAPLMTVTSDKQNTNAYEMFASSYTWGEHGWICACGMEPTSSLQQIAEELPKVRYNHDFSYTLRENVELCELVIYDQDFKQMEGVAELADLHPGKYYVCYRVEEKGRYIEKEEQYEVTTYYCVFELNHIWENDGVG